jgi:cytochrome c oxidase cbb3-type subunit 3
MRAWRALLVVSVLLILAAAVLLLWEKRAYRTSPAAGAAFTDTISVTHLFPGGEPPANLPPPDTSTHDGLSAADVAAGKRLYSWFNCVGCHANGGGAIGPALMDDQWIYGSEPRNIFASILEGRPNGMPSFRGKIPDAQVWQLVAYVRSMSGHVPKPMRPGRNDGLSAKKPESRAPKLPARDGGTSNHDQGETTR